MTKEDKNISEIITHLGEERTDYYQSVAPPIIQTSNFTFATIDEFRNKILEEEHNHVYSRGNNPTVQILRKKLAALENAEDALVTSSGAAAISAAVIAFVKSGDHVICVQKPYSWTYKLLAELLAKFGVETTFVDGSKNEEIRLARKENTVLLFLESPNSLTFELQDLEWCAHFAKSYNITTIIDNSYASPLFQNPLDYGLDITVHSGTKYLNGHSDVVVGVICGSKTHLSRIFHSPFMTLGQNISPHDAWLVLRGLRTLELRMKRSDETTRKLVGYLAKHPKVDRIFYPFLPDFPQYKLAQKQMKGCGGLFTLALKVEKKQQVETFVSAIRNFLMAVSWGGYESLMVPSLVFHDIKGREDSPIPWNYIRFYIGLEEYEYLREDLSQALDRI